MTQQDLDFINFHKESNDTTKLTLKKIQAIWNEFKTPLERDSYCMCDSQERSKYKANFYIFWSSIENDIKNIGL